MRDEEGDPFAGFTETVQLLIWHQLFARRESGYWLNSLPGQAAIDRRQLFMPVDDAHSGRLWAWDVVPNRWGGHPARSVIRVAHAHPGPVDQSGTV